MEVNDRSWYVVRNTPGVTGFVGSATKPILLEPKEVEKILKTQGIESEPKTHISVEVGEEVRITEGPFENCMAVVTEINEEKGTVKEPRQYVWPRNSSRSRLFSNREGSGINTSKCGNSPRVEESQDSFDHIL